MAWPVRSLGELALREKGAIKIGPFGSQLKRDDLVGEGVHVVGIENVLAGQFDGLGGRFITGEKYETLRSFEVRPGDLLITMMGTVGEVAIVPPGTGRSIMDSHLLRFRPNQSVCVPEFVAWFLRSAQSRAALGGRAHGAIMKGLNSSIVRSTPISLPAPSEQRRIVEILDQAHRLRLLRSDADGQADRILPALLNRLIGSPRLWNASPKSEPLGQLVRPISGGTPPKSNGAFWKGEIPWASPKDMKVDFLGDSQDHISSAAVEETNLSLVAEGSVLIVVRGMILARDVPIALTTNSVTINQDMKALVPRSEAVTGAYVWAALSLAKPVLRALVRTAGHGTRKLDTPDLMAFPIPRPDSGQLARVGSIVEHRRQAVSHRQQARRSLESLFSTAMGRAFDGSLTSSWREAHLTELLQEMEQQAKALSAS